MFDNINIVLVNTSHPGNIGSTARAMGVMGFQNLSLVNPSDYPSEVATALAVGCTSILDEAKVFAKYTDAIEKNSVNIGFSARKRKESIPVMMIDECTDYILSNTDLSFNVIFGNEKSGLSNQELLLCNYIVSIPTGDIYSSLNLSSAVQIFTYELFKNWLMNSSRKPNHKKIIDLASTGDKMHFYASLTELLESTNFINKKNHKSITKKLHILFNKAELENHELSILNGILTSIRKKINT
tara:strand:- start:1006 stop:1728 length:723 start_codon:yes stop_codon:yes gene_type:complete